MLNRLANPEPCSYAGIEGTLLRVIGCRRCLLDGPSSLDVSSNFESNTGSKRASQPQQKNKYGASHPNSTATSDVTKDSSRCFLSPDLKGRQRIAKSKSRKIAKSQIP